jgi:hypothetical protein
MAPKDHSAPHKAITLTQFSASGHQGGSRIAMPSHGVRVAKSFASKDNWYRINRHGARWLIIYGVCLALDSLVALILPPPKTVNFWFWTVSLAPLLLLPIPLVAIFNFAKTLPDGE